MNQRQLKIAKQIYALSFVYDVFYYHAVGVMNKLGYKDAEYTWNHKFVKITFEGRTVEINIERQLANYENLKKVQNNICLRTDKVLRIVKYHVSDYELDKFKKGLDALYACYEDMKQVQLDIDNLLDQFEKKVEQEVNNF